LSGKHRQDVRLLCNKLAIAPSILAVSNLDLLPRSISVSLFCAYRKPSAGGFGDVVTAFETKLPLLLLG
jgi:hypothetical protein